MKKLKLQLDDLRVESFVTARGAAHRGTVQANVRTDYCTQMVDCTIDFCGPDTGTGTGTGTGTMEASCYGTCDASCNGTCNASCNGTCVASCNGTCDATCASCGWSCYESDCGCVSIQASACNGMICP